MYRKTTVDEFVQELSRLAPGEIINFAVGNENDKDNAANYGAGFHDLIEGNCLVIGYWGGHSESSSINSKLFNVAAEEIPRYPGISQAIETHLRNIIDYESGDGFIYVKPVRYQASVQYLGRNGLGPVGGCPHAV